MKNPEPANLTGVRDRRRQPDNATRSLRGIGRMAWRRAAFTLIELLLVISIILILASLAVGVMRGAQEDAKEAATLSRIKLIESIMLQEMENYEVRRLPVSNAILTAYVNANRLTGPPAVPVRVQVRNLRRRIVAEIIRSEIAGWFVAAGTFQNNPDLGVFPSATQFALGTPYGAPFDQTFEEWLRVTAYPNPVNINGTPVRLDQLLARDRYVPSRVRYWRRFNNTLNPSPGNANFDLPGEYLYRILEQVDVEGTSGVEALGPSAVGDPDGDGIPDIVDSWGESMQLRILQVSFNPALSNIAEDVYVDVNNVNWSLKDPTTLLPVGYEVINPIIPRSIQSFRIQVVSPKLDSYTQ